MPREALSLLDVMLAMNPSKRCTAVTALNHVWLKTIDPEKVEPPQLPTHQDCHEMWSKKNKKQRQRADAANRPPSTGNLMAMGVNSASSRGAAVSTKPTQPAPPSDSAQQSVLLNVQSGGVNDSILVRLNVIFLATLDAEPIKERFTRTIEAVNVLKNAGALETRFTEWTSELLDKLHMVIQYSVKFLNDSLYFAGEEGGNVTSAANRSSFSAE